MNKQVATTKSLKLETLSGGIVLTISEAIQTYRTIPQIEARNRDAQTELSRAGIEPKGYQIESARGDSLMLTPDQGLEMYKVLDLLGHTEPEAPWPPPHWVADENAPTGTWRLTYNGQNIRMTLYGDWA